MQYDFGGYATRTNIKCADGRTIRDHCFDDMNGMTVPLMWQHAHNDPDNVLGHAVLESRDDGVWAYCSLNNTPEANHAREMIAHGDIRSLSIYANKLVQRGGNVIHGVIREVSLVIAGSNPGAYIEEFGDLKHSALEDVDTFEAIIYTNDVDDNYVAHSDDDYDPDEDYDNDEYDPEEDNDDADFEDSDEYEDEESDEEFEHADTEGSDMADNGSEKTVQDVLNEMTDEQKKVMYYLISQAVAEAEGEGGDDEEDEGDTDMKHNLFDQEEDMAYEDVLSHDAMEEMIEDAARFGSLRESVLAHSAEYGIEDIDYMFPDAKTLYNQPDFIQRETAWVRKVLDGVHHSPFSRVKSIHADLREDEARALGYIKGKLKKEEVFPLLKRVTNPTTIYKKQKMDRDDIVDITDFDVIVWLKNEMRMMLDEELARAILIGDGRDSSSEDHINDTCIRPIVSDADLYTIKFGVQEGATDDATAKNIIRGSIKCRKDFRGKTTPTFFCTEDTLTDMLLLEDTIGRKLYSTEAELATALRVKEICTVPVMENQKVTVNSTSYDVLGIIVCLDAYNVGADKGGAVNMFDDFDIDYNQQKYLIETRASGAMVNPLSAVTLYKLPKSAS